MSVTTTEIAIGLVGTQVVISEVSTTPIIVLENPVPQGRHMITFYDIDGSTYIGAIDVMFAGGPQTLNVSDTCYQNSVNEWDFNYGDGTIAMTYDTVNNNLSMTSTAPFSDLLIREFLIPVFADTQNEYAADQIKANLSATNSPVTFLSPIVQAATGVNAVNLGQITSTQTTSISTAVTANGPSGIITTVSASTASGSTDSFTVNNSTVASTSAVIATLCGYTGTSLPPMITVSSISTGSFNLNITNIDPTNALNGVLTISFLSC